MLKSILSHVFRNQIVALLSVIVAFSAMLYNGHRNELTERNRNIRIAEFEILRNLAELQQMVDATYFQRGGQGGGRTFALSRILVIRDLALLSPEPVQKSAENLMVAWRNHGEKVDTSLEAAQVVSEEILSARRVVVASLRSLK